MKELQDRIGGNTIIWIRDNWIQIYNFAKDNEAKLPKYGFMFTLDDIKLVVQHYYGIQL